MGPNGAWKSTLANVLMGHPAYDVTDGAVTFTGKNNQPMDLLEMKVDAPSVWRCLDVILEKSTK